MEPPAPAAGGTRPPRVFVIAGTAAQWEYWLKHEFLPAVQPSKVKGTFGHLEVDGVQVHHVRDAHWLRGRRIEEAKGDKVVLYGTYQERKDWPEIAAELTRCWWD